MQANNYFSYSEFYYFPWVVSVIGAMTKSLDLFVVNWEYFGVLLCAILRQLERNWKRELLEWSADNNNCFAEKMAPFHTQSQEVVDAN